MGWIRNLLGTLTKREPILEIQSTSIAELATGVVSVELGKVQELKLYRVNHISVGFMSDKKVTCFGEVTFAAEAKPCDEAIITKYLIANRHAWIDLINKKVPKYKRYGCFEVGRY